MKTTITRSILAFLDKVVERAILVHIANLESETAKAHKAASRAYARAEDLAAAAAAAAEDADEMQDMAFEVERRNEKEAAKLLGRI